MHWATKWPHTDQLIKILKYNTVNQWCASKCAAYKLNFWGLFFPWDLDSPIPFNAVGEYINEQTRGRNFVCLVNTSFNQQKWVCRWIYLFSLLAVESLFPILRVFEQISLKKITHHYYPFLVTKTGNHWALQRLALKKTRFFLPAWLRDRTVSPTLVFLLDSTLSWVVDESLGVPSPSNAGRK